MAAILIIVGIVMIYPLLYEVFVSLSDPLEYVKQRGIMLRPAGFSLLAYKIALGSKLIWSGFKNTLLIEVVGVTINLVMTSLGAYFLTRKNVLWKKPINFMIIVTMYFSGGLVPTYLAIRNYGLYNSFWALVLPVALSTYNMILLRSYFATIPDSLAESVTMDGGGHFTILTQIYIPLSKPGMMVILLYYAVQHWNSWFSASIYLRDSSEAPLQLVLRNMFEDESTNLLNLVQNYDNYDALREPVKAAMMVISTLPIICLYPFLQKYFEGGIMIGSLKE
ncbi:MAG: carbohydrate ABC transporter permease [Lachnospiraceae bacterium]|nr:carbohydrate ABC transporter permease [Lachnospiraceae bacterium]